MTDAYDDRLASQIEQYRKVENIHELPDIFHYWSNKYLRSRLNTVFEADSVPEFFAQPLLRSGGQKRSPRFLSVGAGDCGLEVSVAKSLKSRGCENFTLECLEVSSHQIDRANVLIESEGLAKNVKAIQTDINSWTPNSMYDGVIANQSLHHFVELEILFETIHDSLEEDGVFVTSDVIGRNGHMRWPEVLEIVNKIWATLPSKAKYNHQLARFEEVYENWDCSKEGFEGIRAQDILPLLVKSFKFEGFLAYGGVIDIFVSRAFGHNYDVNRIQDLALIDFIQYLDDVCTDNGVIKPTNILAVMRPRRYQGGCRQWRHWHPSFCVREVR